MSEHTPGPWERYPILSGSENDRGFRVWAHDGRDGKTWIADVSPVIDNERGEASEAGKANAALIVAAPDLLEALRAVEWGGALHIWGESFSCCPACQTPAPFYVDKNYPELLGDYPGVHSGTCVLARAIAKAEGR